MGGWVGGRLGGVWVGYMWVVGRENKRPVDGGGVEWRVGGRMDERVNGREGS